MAAIGFVPAALPSVAGVETWPAWAIALVTLLAALVVEGFLLTPSHRVESVVEAPPCLYVGSSDPLHVKVSGTVPRLSLGGALLFDLDPLLEPRAETRFDFKRAASDRVQVELLPRKRGLARIDAIWLRWEGPLGLLSMTVKRKLDIEIPVTPNVRAVKAAAVRFFSRNDYSSGLKVERYLGDGSEFDRLREFVRGLDSRAIDWKASARHHRMMSREYRAERNHEIVLVFDTGHRMGEPLAGIPRLDHAVNAGLLLAYCSLKTGDRVSLFAFDERVRMRSAPVSGTAAMPKIQHRLADLSYSRGEANYTLGLTDLSTRLRRRALVVVFTEFADTITAELMVENLGRLARRHVVLFVCLRDPALSALVEAPPYEDLDVGRAVVASEIERDREVVLRRLARSGIQCVDADHDGMSTQLLDRYLEVKRREMI